MFCLLLFAMLFFVYLSLYRLPYNFFSFSQSLFFIGFLEISFKMVYPTIGIDGKRCRKIQKDRKRYEKIAKDGGGVRECRFSCDVENARVL